MKTRARTARAAQALTARVLLALALALTTALATMGAAGNPTLEDARFLLRAAIRDTVGHGNDPARLDSLGIAYFRLARLPEATVALRRAIALAPTDQGALATLGRIALWQGRLGEADTLLAAAGEAEGAADDRYVLLIRRGDWAGAAAKAEAMNDAGRRELFEKLATSEPFALAEGHASGHAAFERAWPVPLVNVKVNGQTVLMAIDPGASDLLIDPAIVRVQHLPTLPGESSLLWNGSRAGVKHAWVARLEIAGFSMRDVPAAVIALRRYSLDVNPQGTPIAGVIGLSVLSRFEVTLDVPNQSLELRRPGTAYAPSQGQRVPFELWGESDLMVYGSINGGRRMVFQVGTGLPGGAIGAPASVFDELGLKPSRVGNLVKGAGTFLQGRPWDSVPVPTITLGAVVRDKATGWSGVYDDGELWRYGARRDGLLGPEVFRGRRVTFDWAKHALLFEGD